MRVKAYFVERVGNPGLYCIFTTREKAQAWVEKEQQRLREHQVRYEISEQDIDETEPTTGHS